MSQIKDISNKRYGSLLVQAYIYTKNHKAYWECRCDCGNTTIQPGYTLTRGTTVSCGCARSKNMIKYNKRNCKS